MKPLKIGVVVESLELPLRQALEEAVRLGVSGVQVDARGDLAPDRLTETGRREIRNLLRSRGLELTALHCPLRHGLDNPENLQPRIEHVRKVMQLAFDLGPRKVILAGPRVPSEAEPGRQLHLRESLAELGAYGDRVGTLLALEVGWDSPELLRDYLKTFDCGSLKLNYDPANLLVNGHDPLARLAVLKDWIVHVHARDARAATVSRSAQEVPLGAGDIDWLALTATLRVIDYDGYLVVEREGGSRRLQDVAHGVAFLRRFLHA